MIISLIVAASSNNAIGKNNQLLWHLPNDLKFFKNTTWGMPVAMGRKTFESMGSKPLQGRTNLIITRNQNWQADNTISLASIQDAIFFAKSHDYKELFIAGGGEIYEQALSIADRIYLTRVHTEIEGDTFFPEVAPKKWKLIKTDHRFKDDKHLFDYSFELWEKI